ncbi:MAG: SAM-dependent methyltransferase [Bryobacterales bacterium]|jgi:2-polyprenyl-3-methyl-5-hydroxy-6-metoxy-1,4-benzoquinol methylase|nr:SAM-dependent methyltransferase [Bryobacterales bacterium]
MPMSDEVRQCIVCRSSESSVVFVDFGVPILRCTGCKHIYSSYAGNQNYSEYYGREINDQEKFRLDPAHLRMYRDFGNRFMAGRSGKILDVGAGLGYFVRFAESYQGWEAFGYEICAPAVDYAKNQLGVKNMYAGRVEDSGFPLASFDLMTLWDVIEHIPNPDGFLQYLRSLLKPAGAFFLATPNGPAQLWKARAKKTLIGMREGGHYLEPRDHMNLYTPDTLDRVLKRAGFQSVKFVHLPPIQAVSESGNPLGLLAKNAWFRIAQVVHAATGSRANINHNLYAIATTSVS